MGESREVVGCNCLHGTGGDQRGEENELLLPHEHASRRPSVLLVNVLAIS